MSNDRKPLARLSIRIDKQTHAIATIWPGKFPGTYDISRDKSTEKFPAMGLFDALKAWGGGTGYLGFSVESERERRDGGAPRSGGYSAPSGGDFADDDLPF